MPYKFVEVNIDNILKYTQVVSVLDNPKVYETIIRLREKWNIKGFYNSKDSEHHSAGEKLSDEVLEGLQNDVEDLRTKCNLDPVFDEVFLMAITFNKIADEDYKTAFLNISNFPTGMSDSHYSIDITPYTGWAELRKVFLEFKGMLKLAQETQEYSDFLPTISKKLINDVKGNIKRDRKWYWLWKRGKKPLEISRAASERRTINPYEYRDNVVEKALNNYKKLISEKD